METGALGGTDTARRDTGNGSSGGDGVRVHTASPVMATRANVLVAAGTGRYQT